MLVLNRLPNDTHPNNPELSILRIGDSIRVQIVSVRGQTVRIGIEAPDGVSVWREELYLKIVDGAKKKGTSSGRRTNAQEDNRKQ